MLFSIIFLPAVFLLGIIISYEDFKNGKIRNKWILSGYAYGLLAFLILVILKFSNFYQFNLVYLKDVFINALISFLVGYFLWRFNFWTAGDAKLFALFSFLTPLNFYYNSYYPYFPSFAFLINIFSVAFLTLFLQSFYEIFLRIKNWFASLKGFIFSAKKTFNIKIFFNKNKFKKYSYIVVIFFSVFIFLQILKQNFILFLKFNYELLNIFTNILFSTLFTLLIVFFQFKKKIFLIFIASLFFYFALISLLSFEEAYSNIIFIFKNFNNSIIFIVIIISIIIIVNFYIKRKEIKTIRVDNLKPKMLLTEEYVGKLKENKNFFQKHIGQIYSEGISIEQLNSIKNFLKERNTQYVSIYKTTPFAFWIIIGLWLTVLFKTNLIQLIFDVVSKF